jgi:hypothetical protein
MIVHNPLLALPLTAADLERGAAWYPAYRTRITRLGRRYGYDDRLVLAAFAALSPRATVRSSMQALYRCLVAHRNGLSAVDVDCSMPGKSGSGVMYNRVAAAFRALDGDVRGSIRSLKVRSFYMNLRGRESEVTVDTWAAQPFGYAPGEKFGKPVYRRIREGYRTAALAYGVSPATFQAAAWVYLRGGAN